MTVKRGLLRRIFNVFFFFVWLIYWSSHSYSFYVAERGSCLFDGIFMDVLIKRLNFLTFWVSPLRFMQGTYFESKRIKWKLFSGACLNALFIRIWKICLSIPNSILPASKITFALVYYGEWRIQIIPTTDELFSVYWWRLQTGSNIKRMSLFCHFCTASNLVLI